MRFGALGVFAVSAPSSLTCSNALIVGCRLGISSLAHCCSWTRTRNPLVPNDWHVRLKKLAEPRAEHEAHEARGSKKSRVVYGFCKDSTRIQGSTKKAVRLFGIGLGHVNCTHALRLRPIP